MQARVTDRPVGQVVAAIRALDLDPIKHKLMDTEEGQGWSRDYVDQMEIAYKRFLTLLVRYPEETIAPSKDVDKFWHGHILDTLKYAKDCQNVFGNFLHHFPYFGMRGAEDAANLAAAARNMKRLTQQEFGSAQDDNSLVWSKGRTTAEGAALCGAAVQVKDTALCGAAVQLKDTALCGAAVQVKDTALCGAAVQLKDTALCGAAVQVKDTALCGAAVQLKDTALCGAAVQVKDTALCGAAVQLKDTALCGAAVQVKDTALCGAAVQVKDSARSTTMAA
jgi:hypothetical protein